MKIKEILELTQTKSIEEIANEHLTINPETTRKALKRAGCFKWVHEKTKWQQDEDEPSNKLEQSIYNFTS